MAEYINKQELLKEIDDLKKSPWYNDGYGFGLQQARHDGVNVVVDLCINQAPTVDVVEVNHGYWVKNAPNPEVMKSFHELGIAKAMRENSIYWTCSCCNKWGFPYSKYCSECGAKMDGKGVTNND